MIIRKFKLFESNKEEDEILKLYDEWKSSTEKNKNIVLNKIKREALKSSNLKAWFTKFTGNREVVVELKKIKYKNSNL